MTHGSWLFASLFEPTESLPYFASSAFYIRSILSNFSLIHFPDGCVATISKRMLPNAKFSHSFGS